MWYGWRRVKYDSRVIQLQTLQIRRWCLEQGNPDILHCYQFMFPTEHDKSYVHQTAVLHALTDLDIVI